MDVQEYNEKMRGYLVFKKLNVWCVENGGERINIGEVIRKFHGSTMTKSILQA